MDPHRLAEERSVEYHRYIAERLRHEPEVLEVHDLLVAKPIAGREKDFTFLEEAARHRMANPEVLLQRLATVEIDPAVRENARGAIARAFRLV
jgi:hypothetical protein